MIRLSLKTLLLLLLYPILGFSNNLIGFLEKAFLKLESNNPEIRYYFYNKEAQKYRAKQAIDQYKPSINLTIYYGYDSYKVKNEQIQTTLKYFSISLTQPIFHPEILSQWNKEINNYNSSKYDYLDTIQKQRLSLLTFIIDSILLQKKLILFEKERKIYISLLKEYNKLLNVGKISFSKYLYTYRAYKNILKNINDIKTQLKLLKSKIKILIGENLEPNFTFSFNCKMHRLYEFLKPFLKNEKFENFSLKSLEFKIKAAKAELKVRKYNRWPKLDLLASYTYSTSTAVSVATTDKKVMLVLTFPIYNGGKNIDAVKEAENLLKASYENFLMEKRNVFENFSSYREDLKKYLTYLNYDCGLINKVKQEVSLYKNLVKTRLKPKFEFLEKKLEFLNIKITYINDLRDFLNAFFNLLYVSSSISLKNLQILNIIFTEKEFD